VSQNFGNLMKQARQLQERMARLQEELGTRTVEASSGGGMVTVVANGKNEIVSLKIDREVLGSGDAEMLQDLILAAVNEGIRKSQAMVSSEMSKLTGGLNIPGMM